MVLKNNEAYEWNKLNINLLNIAIQLVLMYKWLSENKCGPSPVPKPFFLLTSFLISMMTVANGKYYFKIF